MARRLRESRIPNTNEMRSDAKLRCRGRCQTDELNTQVKQPRPLTTIYGLIRPSWPDFTVTLRVTWLRIMTVFLRIVYDEIRSSTSTKKWLLPWWKETGSIRPTTIQIPQLYGLKRSVIAWSVILPYGSLFTVDLRYNNVYFRGRYGVLHPS